MIRDECHAVVPIPAAEFNDTGIQMLVTRYDNMGGSPSELSEELVT